MTWDTNEKKYPFGALQIAQFIKNNNKLDILITLFMCVYAICLFGKSSPEELVNSVARTVPFSLFWRWRGRRISPESHVTSLHNAPLFIILHSNWLYGSDLSYLLVLPLVVCLNRSWFVPVKRNRQLWTLGEKCFLISCRIISIVGINTNLKLTK